MAANEVVLQLLELIVFNGDSGQGTEPSVDSIYHLVAVENPIDCRPAGRHCFQSSFIRLEHC